MAKKIWWFLIGELIYFVALSLSIYRIITEGVTDRLQIALVILWIIVLLLTILLWATGWRRSVILVEAFEQINGRLEKINPWIKGIAFLMMIAIPLPLIYTNIDRGLVGDLDFRALVILPLLIVAALLWPSPSPRNYFGRVAVSILAMAYLHMSAYYLSQVNSFPLSITWSEGNRFYDYSLIFGKEIYQYQGELSIPYGAPGRYGLWGIWFVFPSLPIWFHRFWNAALWFVPTLLLGWFVAAGVESKPVRLAVALWVALFLNQGPIYTPLVLAAIVVAIFIQEPRLWLRSTSVALASFYAGLSRWTWVSAPAIWGVLIDVCLFYPRREGAWYRRLAPTALIALLGSLPGVLANLDRFTAPQTTTLSLSQPLLWYRLLPSATYERGILVGLAIATGPLLLLLIWLIVSRRWELDWLQIIAVAGAVAGTLVAGLVASTKIGGGSNLHNLDMFLVTLVMLVGIFLATAKPFTLRNWPAWTQVFVVLAILIPSLSILSLASPLNLPAGEDVQNALQKMQRKIDSKLAEGEILFMDQRQLLTFGYIEGVELVPEYEKKYVMDQAMAGNADYFKQFYQDLAERRFSLIVSEPLFTRLQDRSNAFSEENNAWVKWVSRPLLCYYKPSEDLKKVKIQLLVPRNDVDDCRDKYPPE